MLKFQSREKKPTRAGFGEALLALGEENPQVVALCADLTTSLHMHFFRDAFPDRFFQAGVAEANMMGVAAGLATGGKIPFTGTFANFSTGRVYDQVRQSIAYSRKNVKICASHAGLSLGEDGATHQILEDLGMMKMLPHMTVINPCDYHQTRAATWAIAKHQGPVYLRFGRPSMPNFTSPTQAFEIGKAQHLIRGRDVTLFALGHLVWEAIVAEAVLAEKGIQASVLNIHTLKPLDEEAIVRSARETGCVVTAEEHQYQGGLGASIAQCLGKHAPVPMEQVAVQDTFGESGKPLELMYKYGLTSEPIVEAALRAIARKKEHP